MKEESDIVKEGYDLLLNWKILHMFVVFALIVNYQKVI
jgi:hypothetical protein